MSRTVLPRECTRELCPSFCDFSNNTVCLSDLPLCLIHGMISLKHVDEAEFILLSSRSTERKMIECNMQFILQTFNKLLHVVRA